MSWSTSLGVDVSHWQTIADYARARAAVDWVQIKLTEGTGWLDSAAATHYRGFAGRPRGAYHFARTNVSVRDQVAHFLARRAAIGEWERADMLDFEPIKGDPPLTAAFVRDVVAEYRRQSGRQRVLVYTPVDPTGWWDPDCTIWRARYRGTGMPAPEDWAVYLGWAADHPGLGILQWDDSWPLPGGPAAGVDVNSERTPTEAGMTQEQYDYIAGVLDRVSWRLWALLQFEPTTSGGPSEGESLALPRALNALVWRVDGLTRALDTVAAGPLAGEPVELVARLGALAADVAEIRARPAVDVAALAAELAPRLQLVDVGVLAVAVADELDRRARDGDSATGPTT